MRVFCWNIRHGGRKNRDSVLTRCLHHDADVIVLTEFRNNDVGDFFVDNLREHGWAHTVTGEAEPKVNTILVASKHPVTAAGPLRQDLGKPHRMIDVRIDGLALTTVAMPNFKEKFPYWDAVIETGRDRLGQDALFIGDFNTGKHYLDERGATFVATDHMEALEALGFVDVWRRDNPDAREFSWYSPQAQNGFRLDHAFASPSLAARVSDVRYSHFEREARLSDHSALIVAWDD